MTRGTAITLPTDERVPATLSCLAHELVHAIAGRSPSHLLNEGLAIHVDSTLRLAGPVWPFFELAPDRWVASFIEEGMHVSLADLVPSATPQFSEGGRKYLVPSYYLEAGSFTGYLWSRYPQYFWSTFRHGKGELEGRELASFEDEWLATLRGPLTAGERVLRDRSFAAFERILEDIERLGGPAAGAPAVGAGPARG